jgi:hypothetical protein
MNLRTECKKMISKLWDLSSPRDRHIYNQWMISHIGTAFKHAPYESLKTLKYILEYKLEHGKCPFHEEHNREKKRRQLLGNDWQKIRAKVILERGPHCEECGKRDLVGHDLTVDHIIPLNQDGKSVPKNLKILCFNCHKLKTRRNREGSKAWKKFVKTELKGRVEQIRLLANEKLIRT